MSKIDRPVIPVTQIGDKLVLDAGIRQRKKKMTSKEALEKLYSKNIHLADYDHYERDWCDAGLLKEWFDEELDVIKKDLEVLEILKNSVKRTSYSIDSAIAPIKVITIEIEETEGEEYRKVEEWSNEEEAD